MATMAYDNFQLKDRMARNFMQCAEQFGNWHLNADLNQSQMIALSAEGKQVADMTIKQLRAGCKFYPVVDDERARRRQRGFSHGAEKIPNAKNLITQRTGAREKVSDKERDNRRPYFLLRKCQKKTQLEGSYI